VGYRYASCKPAITHLYHLLSAPRYRVFASQLTVYTYMRSQLRTKILLYGVLRPFKFSAVQSARTYVGYTLLQFYYCTSTFVVFTLYFIVFRCFRLL